LGCRFRKLGHVNVGMSLLKLKDEPVDCGMLGCATELLVSMGVNRMFAGSGLPKACVD
jgi:hypothetical protein